jgi:hypothetical protein
MPNTHLLSANNNESLHNCQAIKTPQSCQNCGSTLAKLCNGKAPHTASLLCADCGKWIKWVGKAELAKLTGGAR